MGGIQSKIWSEVPTGASPGSPSETGERCLSSIDQTPTGPSVAHRFKAASIDPRSPSCAGFTRTPIIIKQTEEEVAKNTDNIDTKKDVAAPTRGMAIAANTSNTEEELEKLTYKMNLDSNEEEIENDMDDEKEGKETSTTNDEKDNLPKPAAHSRSIGKSATLESDRRSPLLIERSDEPTILNLRPNCGITTRARCGKKTMFPMTLDFAPAKSPRSPLTRLPLNANFQSGAGDSAVKTKKGRNLRSSSKLEDFSDDQENGENENTSLVI